jgi:hypothetical protein
MAMGSSIHHPKVLRRLDGRWEIQCPECQWSSESTPFGIGMSLEDEVEARCIWENHAAAQGRNRLRRSVA